MVVVSEAAFGWVGEVATRSDTNTPAVGKYRIEAHEMYAQPKATQKLLDEYGAFTQSIIQSGNFKAADRLRPTATATTVRIRDGKTLTTDGPFAETREQLGGYYLIEAKDLDAAIEIAARIPTARIGSIEVRPIWLMSDYSGPVSA